MKCIILALIALAVAAPALAQPVPTQRLAGTIERVDGHSIVVRPAKGDGSVTIELADKTTLFAVSKAALADVKPGSYVGVGAMPQADGTQRAVQVTVMAESQRGLSEGHRPWDRAPNSTMTNGTVDTVVKAVEDHVLIVKYKGGEQRIVVPPGADILAYSAADRSELKVGTHVAILRAHKNADGTLEADRVNVGRGEVVPQ